MLNQKHCAPCEGGVPPLTKSEAEAFLSETEGWLIIRSNLAIEKQFRFKNFQEALDFTNKVGALAEAEGHHPDILIHNWNKVTVTLSTHAIGGLSENDFIVAAKINELT